MISKSPMDGCLDFLVVLAGDIEGPRGWSRPPCWGVKSFSGARKSRLTVSTRVLQMSSRPPSAAGSVSKVECNVAIGGRLLGKLSLFRHLAPLTVNAVLRSIPFDSRVSLQPAMVCLFTQLKVGVEKPRMQFARGDVAFLASGGLVCVFLGEARSDRPLNPIGKVESGMESFDAIRLGDVVRVSLAEPAQP